MDVEIEDRKPFGGPRCENVRRAYRDIIEYAEPARRDAARMMPRGPHQRHRLSKPPSGNRLRRPNSRARREKRRPVSPRRYVRVRVRKTPAGLRQPPYLFDVPGRVNPRDVLNRRRRRLHLAKLVQKARLREMFPQDHQPLRALGMSAGFVFQKCAVKE